MLTWNAWNTTTGGITDMGIPITPIYHCGSWSFQHERNTTYICDGDGVGLLIYNRKLTCADVSLIQEGFNIGFNKGLEVGRFQKAKEIKQALGL
jgi:hypothetical protein